MHFDLHVDNRGDVYIVSVCGDVDYATAPHLNDCLQEGISAGRTSLAIDLQKCTYFDSEGIKVLFRTLRIVGKQGQVIICGSCAGVRRIFEISGLDQFLQFLPSIDDILHEPALVLLALMMSATPIVKLLGIGLWM